MEQRLATMLAIDAVGYSHLIMADEEPTLTILDAYRQVIGLFADHRAPNPFGI